MTSDQFVTWLESKLTEHGRGKVVPAAGVLERHARRLLARRLAADRVAALLREIEAEAAHRALPADLAKRVRQELAPRLRPGLGGCARPRPGGCYAWSSGVTKVIGHSSGQAATLASSTSA